MQNVRGVCKSVCASVCACASMCMCASIDLVVYTPVCGVLFSCLLVPSDFLNQSSTVSQAWQLPQILPTLLQGKSTVVASVGLHSIMCKHHHQYAEVLIFKGCWHNTIAPLSHGPFNPDSRSGSNPGLTQCAFIQKMAFNEALLLFIFFWLRWRRLRLARARIRRIPAAQSIELAVVVAHWRLTSHIAISAALRLLQGNRLKRRVWAKPRSASLYQDIVQGWNDADFKVNFRVSRTNFVYLVNELQPVLQRQQLLRSTIPLNNCIRPHVQKEC